MKSKVDIATELQLQKIRSWKFLHNDIFPPGRLGQNVKSVTGQL